MLEADRWTTVPVVNLLKLTLSEGVYTVRCVSAKFQAYTSKSKKYKKESLYLTT